MDSALHDNDGDAIDGADHEISSVADCGAAWKGWNFDVRNMDGVTQFVGESAEPRAEDECNSRTQWRARQNRLGGVVGMEEFFEVGQGACAS
jgi:hypothetical protein